MLSCLYCIYKKATINTMNNDKDKSIDNFCSELKKRIEKKNPSVTISKVEVIRDSKRVKLNIEVDEGTLSDWSFLSEE